MAATDMRLRQNLPPPGLVGNVFCARRKGCTGTRDAAKAHPRNVEGNSSTPVFSRSPEKVKLFTIRENRILLTGRGMKEQKQRDLAASTNRQGSRR